MPKRLNFRPLKKQKWSTDSIPKFQYDKMFHKELLMIMTIIVTAKQQPQPQQQQKNKFFSWVEAKQSMDGESELSYA